MDQFAEFISFSWIIHALELCFFMSITLSLSKSHQSLLCMSMHLWKLHLSFVFMRVLHYWYLEINLEICLKTRKFHELARRQLERLVVDFQRWFMQWWYSFKGGRHTLKSFENRHHLCINSGRWVDRQTGWQVNNNKNPSTCPLSTQRLFDLSIRGHRPVEFNIQ